MSRAGGPKIPAFGPVGYYNGRNPWPAAKWRDEAVASGQISYSQHAFDVSAESTSTEEQDQHPALSDFLVILLGLDERQAVLHAAQLQIETKMQIASPRPLLLLDPNQSCRILFGYTDRGACFTNWLANAQTSDTSGLDRRCFDHARLG